MNRLCFVYGLVESQGVRYVGYSTRLNERRKEHRRDHPCWHFLVLGAYPTRELGLERERWWIRRLWKAGHPLTNITEGSNGAIVGATRSYLTRERISVANKKRWASPEARAKQSAKLRGRIISAETRARLSAAHIGKSASLEARIKMSATRTGKCHSLESRAKIASANSRRIISDETRAKMSESAKRRWEKTREGRGRHE